MNSKKFLLAAVLCFILIFSFVMLYAGSGKGKKKEAAGPVRVAEFTNGFNNIYTVVIMEGSKKAAEDFGVEVDFFDPNFDTNAQLNQIEDAIVTGKYDIFSIMPLDASVLPPIVDKALAEGITVIAHNNPIGSPDLYYDRSDKDYGLYKNTVSYVGHRTINVGKAAGELAIEALDGKPGKVCIISGMFEMQMSIDNNRGFEMAIADHPEIEIVANQQNMWDRAQATAVMENFLQANDDIDVVYVHDDNSAIGAVLAIEEAGRLDEIKVISLGGMKEGLKAIDEGKLYGSIMFLPYEEGYRSVEYGYKQYQGEKIPGFIDLAYDPKLKGKGIKITKENLNDFEGEW
jgi:ribose transport system substrate-binding protein